MAQTRGGSQPENSGRARTMALKLPSVWGSCLMLVAALVFGTGNIPGLVALVVICAIWIWYEAGPVAS